MDSIQINSIRSLVAADLEKIEKRILEQTSSEIFKIQEISRHLLEGGGKRLRPLLLLLSAYALGYKGNLHVEFGALIEIIHTATLLHDDVIDESSLRHNQKTANALWGNTLSVLVGDFLYSRAFESMIRTRHMEALKKLSQATSIIVEGEILQLLHRNNPETTEKDYMDIISRKTGSLFEVASHIGGILAEASQEEQQAIGQYGLYLGIAFQLIDDIMDYTSPRNIMGKNIGDDLTEGKPTLPLIYALQNTQNTSHQQIITESIQKGTLVHLDKILDIIHLTDAIKYIKALAKMQIDKALEYLKVLPHSQYTEALYQLAQFAIQRNY